MDEVTFTKEKLKTIFEGRINTQSRLSGDKVWLPLSLLGKICSNYQNAKKDELLHIKFKHEIYNRLRIVVKDSSGIVFHKKVKDVCSLTLNDDGVACKMDDDNEEYTVMTPTGYLNERVPMKANSMSDIVIDHVTPIDSTLSRLNLPELDKISNRVKECKENWKKKNKYLSGKELESQTFVDYEDPENPKSSKIWRNIDFSKLSDELNAIINDSHYRLMSETANSEKSNALSYISFYKLKDKEKYYARIGHAIDDATGQTKELYQDLDSNAVIRLGSIPDDCKEVQASQEELIDFL